MNSVNSNSTPKVAVEDRNLPWEVLDRIEEAAYACHGEPARFHVSVLPTLQEWTETKLWVLSGMLRYYGCTVEAAIVANYAMHIRQYHDGHLQPAEKWYRNVYENKQNNPASGAEVADTTVVDSELRVMAAIHAATKALEPSAQHRVVGWLTSRLGDENLKRRSGPPRADGIVYDNEVPF